MSYPMWEAIAETPWWMYAFFLWLLFLAYDSTQARIVPLKLSVISSLVFAISPVLAIMFFIHFTLKTILILSGTILVGSVLGWIQFYLQKIKILKNKAAFYYPGSWSLFVLIFLGLAAKWYFGFNIYASLRMNMLSQYTIPVAIFASLILGLAIGRTSYLLKRVKTGPFKE
jgi:hypothetical protein